MPIGATARNAKEHLRTYSSEDGIRKLDYERDLLIGGTNLLDGFVDVGCKQNEGSTNLFALEEAKAILAAT